MNLYSKKVYNYLIFLKKGKGVYTLKQVHGNKVILLRETKRTYKGDALISSLKGKALGVKLADCCGLIVLGKEYFALIHAGWRGTKAKVVEVTLKKFRKRDKPLLAFLSPCARGCCYEVKGEVCPYFSTSFRKGKTFLDLRGEVLKRLRRYFKGRVISVGGCTICNKTFPSFRRDRTRERMLFGVLKLS